MPSVTTTAIRHISKLCAPALAAHGFKRQSPHFHRLMPDGLYHIINFQASQRGSQDAGKFTINLSVTSPWLYTHWTGCAFPKNPASAGLIQARIGHQLPDPHDKWWDIDAATGIEALGAEIARALTKYGLPFFDQYPDSQAILRRLLTNGTLHGLIDIQCPLIIAILLAERGQLDAARDTLLAHLQKEGERYTYPIREIATRLGLKLPIATAKSPKGE